MGISRIEELHYGVEDVAECVRFFEDFGLERAEPVHAGAMFTTPVGQQLSSAPARRSRAARRSRGGLDAPRGDLGGRRDARPWVSSATRWALTAR